MTHSDICQMENAIDSFVIYGHPLRISTDVALAYACECEKRIRSSGSKSAYWQKAADAFFNHAMK